MSFALLPGTKMKQVPSKENAMPELSETAVKIKRRRLLGMIAGTLLFTACSNANSPQPVIGRVTPRGH